jgi:L-cysteate sulfo-lyase
VTALPPREPLGFFPTPLHPLPRLTAHLGGPHLWIKRDDLTGFALGGNKVRKLEFFLAEARAVGADVLVTAGGHQSNHARVTAAAAAVAGLDCVLVLSGGTPAAETGNLALDRLFGASVRFVERGPDRAPALEAVARELRAAGRRPLVIPVGGSTPLGALGYVEAAREAAAQLRALGVVPAAIVHGSSSGGTQAGLMVGCEAAELAARVIGVSADETAAGRGDRGPRRVRRRGLRDPDRGVRGSDPALRAARGDRARSDVQREGRRRADRPRPAEGVPAGRRRVLLAHGRDDVAPATRR